MKRKYVIFLWALFLVFGIWMVGIEKHIQAIAGTGVPLYKTGISSPNAHPVNPPDEVLRDAKDVTYFEGKVDWLALGIETPRTAWEHMQFAMYVQDSLNDEERAISLFKIAIQMDEAVTKRVEPFTDPVRNSDNSIKLNEATLDGKMILPHARLGQIALDRKEYDEAILHFSKIREYDPLMIGILERLGEAFHGKAELDKAISFYLQELDLQQGKNQSVMRELGELYSEKGDTAKSIEFFEKYLEETKFHGEQYPLRIEQVKMKVAELKSSLSNSVILKN